MKVNSVFHIPPDPFELLTLTGESVSIAPPSSWSGLAPVQVRLLSYEWRDGQVGQVVYLKGIYWCKDTAVKPLFNSHLYYAASSQGPDEGFCLY